MYINLSIASAALHQLASANMLGNDLLAFKVTGKVPSWLWIKSKYYVHHISHHQETLWNGCWSNYFFIQILKLSKWDEPQCPPLSLPYYVMPWPWPRTVWRIITLVPPCCVSFIFYNLAPHYSWRKDLCYYALENASPAMQLVPKTSCIKAN